MCHLYPYKNVKLKFFYINICGFIGRGKFLYETRVLDCSYLRYKVQLPTSDSTEITADGIKVRLEGPSQYLVVFLISTFSALVLSVILGVPKIH